MAKMHFSRSIVHTKMGSRDLAIQDLSRTIALDPQHYKAWAKRGALHMEGADYTVGFFLVFFTWL